MFAKGNSKKRNPIISDSSFDAVEYGDNIYTLPTNSSAQINAASDNQIHIDYPPKNDSRFKKMAILAILYLALSINALIILLIVPNRFTSELLSAIPTTISNIWTNKTINAATDISAQPLELQLKNMALSVMQFNNWNAQKLKHIDLSWQSLSDDQQNKLQQEVWFQLFENALIHELNMNKNSTNISTTKPADADALITLAKALNIREIPDSQIAKNEILKQTKTRSTNIKSTIVAKNNSTTPAASNKTNNIIPVKKTLKKQDHKINKTPTQKKKPKSQTNTVTHKQANNPTLSELNDITVQFVDSYEEGNLKKLMSLFSIKAISNRFDNLNDIEQEYANLFRSTSERQIFIRDLKWSYNKGKAVGKGKMETMLMSETDSKIRLRNSRVQLVVEKLGKSTRITRFYELEH